MIWTVGIEVQEYEDPEHFYVLERETGINQRSCSGTQPIMTPGWIERLN